MTVHLILRPRTRLLLVVSAVASALLAGESVAAAQATNPYGYVRVLEGTAGLARTSSDQPTPLQLNQPVMVGDTIIVGSGSRLELLLADHSVARLDAESVLELVELAASPDRNDAETVLRLHQGNLQLSVADGALGQRPVGIEAPNATIYPAGSGHYRITVDHSDWTEVVARDTGADIATDRGNVQIAAGEEALVRGEQQSQTAVRAAGGVDALEAWGDGLEQEVQSADLGGNVDPSLRTEAASLAQYGNWINDNNTAYWQPSAVDADWSPYWNGNWSYTPSGYSWVSTEPWGYVPSHYGTWEYLPVHGWAWRPGSVFAPAWVYWYWGPSYVGWCPVGYYSAFYDALYPGIGFRPGLYGWAGGSAFRRWNFVGFDRFGHTGWRRFGFHGERLEGRVLARGLITTDTRRLAPGLIRQPGRAVQILTSSARRGEIADVSRFVARDLRLSTEVLGAVRLNSRAVVARGTPLVPSSLGRGATGSRTASRAPDGRFATSVPSGEVRARSWSDASTRVLPGAQTQHPEAFQQRSQLRSERLAPSTSAQSGRASASYGQAWRQTPQRSASPTNPGAPSRSATPGSPHAPAPHGMAGVSSRPFNETRRPRAADSRFRAAGGGSPTFWRPPVTWTRGGSPAQGRSMFGRPSGHVPAPHSSGGGRSSSHSAPHGGSPHPSSGSGHRKGG